MSEREEIRLFQCHRCAKQRFNDQLDRGEACKACGSRYVADAPASFKYVFGYLWHEGKMMQFFKENILGREPVCR